MVRRLGPATATLLVAANMIGSGVFTTTGLLLRDLGSPIKVLLVWLVGGVVALAGALTYGELAAAYPSNGGEYRLLSELYHPSVGFIAGWLSLVVGFAAPIAASALGAGYYVHALLPAISQRVSAAAIVVLLALLHASHVTWGARVQNLVTLGKGLLIVGFVVATLWVAPNGALPRLTARVGGSSPGSLAIALVFVSFAYSGWNGAAYVAGEVRNPKRNLPVSLGIGTAMVLVLYVGLNTAFLVSAPLEQLSGVVEVGHVAAASLFGERIAAALATLIALALVSSISAMTMVGPRVYEAMGNDYPALRFLRIRSGSGGPGVSIALQTTLALVMLVTVSFDALLVYVGFTLSLVTLLTVLGVFIHRRRQRTDAGYRTWGYPVTPLLFAGFTLWMVVFSVSQRPVESLVGIATILLGLAFYRLARSNDTKPTPIDGHPNEP